MDRAFESDYLDRIKSALPARLAASLFAADKNTLMKISEIRMRAFLPVSLTIAGENFLLSVNGEVTKQTKNCIKLTAADIEGFVFRFCTGSIYSFADTIKEGYISRNGIRVGICGFYGTGTLTKYTSVNIRIPRHIKNASDRVISEIEREGFQGGGILAVSPPGDGKTTLLRDLAIRLSRGINIFDTERRFRVCIIDERNEIYLPELFSGCLIDVLENCPKRRGIEIATRTLSPEIIICDEIGSDAEAEEIKKAHREGVILISSVHGESLDNLKKKQNIYSLVEDGIFKRGVFLKRNGEQILCETVKFND